MAESEKQAEKSGASQGDDPRYDREALQADSYALTGHPWPVVAGALDGNSGKTFTVTQVKQAVTTYLKREQRSAEDED